MILIGAILTKNLNTRLRAQRQHSKFMKTAVSIHIVFGSIWFSGSALGLFC